MKKIKIEPEKLSLLTELYDEGFELFYSPESQHAFMINEVIVSEEFSSLSSNRDTAIIFEVSPELDALINSVHFYNISRQLTFKREAVTSLSACERRLVNLLSLPTTMYSVERLVSAKEPDKKFLIVEFSHGLKTEDGTVANIESVISVLKRMDGDVYIQQVGKNCKKKMQKKA